MTPEDKQEFKEYIHSTLAGYHSKVDAQNTVTNLKLETIEKHLDKQNNRIGKAEERVDAVEKAELQHFLHCPVSPKLRVIEDLMLSQASVKKFMGVMFMGGIAIGGFIIGLLKLIL